MFQTLVHKLRRNPRMPSQLFIRWQRARRVKLEIFDCSVCGLFLVCFKSLRYMEIRAVFGWLMCGHVPDRLNILFFCKACCTQRCTGKYLFISKISFFGRIKQKICRRESSEFGYQWLCLVCLNLYDYHDEKRHFSLTYFHCSLICRQMVLILYENLICEKSLTCINVCFLNSFCSTTHFFWWRDSCCMEFGKEIYNMKKFFYRIWIILW